MPLFLNTRGLASLAVAVCDRCKMKVPFVTLVADPNFPGLRVCESRGCKDELDPYRLPARKTERIALRFPRPDISVALDPNNLSAGDAYGGAVLSPEQNNETPGNNGNLDGIEVQP